MLTILKGAIIGVANIIPGVSGGTLALVLGIYKRLIAALHNIDVRFIGAMLGVLRGRAEDRRRFRDELVRVDAWFLFLIGAGAIGAIAATSRLMEYLLNAYHDASYAFFFGLILFSIVFPYQYLRRRSWREMLAAALAAALTVSLTLGVSDERKIEKAEAKQAEQQAELIAGAHDEATHAFVSIHVPEPRRAAIVFAAAAIAISAMILPGISGSFLLLLLGVYFEILRAINDREVVTLAIFGVGCVAGLLVFSRLMNWCLERFYDVTIAFMIGLMTGSLYVIWPFKERVVVGDITVDLGNRIPDALGVSEWVALAAFAAGAVIVFVSYILDKRLGREKTLL